MSADVTYEAAVDEGEQDQRVGDADLLDDPRTDVEALCLCALLWASAEVAMHVVKALEATDFDRPVYGELFEAVARQVQAGRPHDPASIAAYLAQSGTQAGHRGGQLNRALSDTTLVGSSPEITGHYAVTVVAAAYRRGFHAAGAAITQAAEELPQAELFEHLVSIGRGQRTATERLRDVMAGLG